jgi:hypothetical protein
VQGIDVEDRQLASTELVVKVSAMGSSPAVVSFTGRLQAACSPSGCRRARRGRCGPGGAGKVTERHRDVVRKWPP